MVKGHFLLKSIWKCWQKKATHVIDEIGLKNSDRFINLWCLYSLCQSYLLLAVEMSLSNIFLGEQWSNSDHQYAAIFTPLAFTHIEVMYYWESHPEKRNAIDRSRTGQTVKYFLFQISLFYLTRWSGADHVKRSNRRLLPSGRCREWTAVGSPASFTSPDFVCVLKPNWKVAELLLSPFEERASKEFSTREMMTGDNDGNLVTLPIYHYHTSTLANYEPNDVAYLLAKSFALYLVEKLLRPFCLFCRHCRKTSRFSILFLHFTLVLRQVTFPLFSAKELCNYCLLKGTEKKKRVFDVNSMRGKDGRKLECPQVLC